MRIKLVNVGRGKVTRTIDIPDGSSLDQIAQEIVEEASKHLISREVEATWDGEHGYIYAGFHSVGEALIE